MCTVLKKKKKSPSAPSVSAFLSEVKVSSGIGGKWRTGHFGKPPPPHVEGVSYHHTLGGWYATWNHQEASASKNRRDSLFCFQPSSARLSGFWSAAINIWVSLVLAGPPSISLTHFSLVAHHPWPVSPPTSITLSLWTHQTQSLSLNTDDPYVNNAGLLQVHVGNEQQCQGKQHVC